MTEIKKVLICGLGAIGSVYATAIHKHTDIDLKVLVDTYRLKRYEDSPIVFNGQKYDFEYTTPDKTDYKADLIIIATKNNNLSEVVESINNFVSEKTLILSLLNGLASEEIIAHKYGKEKVIDSYYIGHTSTRKGRYITQDGVYKTVFGESNENSNSQRILKLKAFFEKTEIPYEIPTDMLYSKWWKFLINVGYNQASVILNAPYNDFQKNEKINNIAIQLMQEAALVAKAEGVKNTENFIPEIKKVIQNMIPETRTSMLQDIDAKRETEVDAFAGYIVKLAKKHNISVPFNQTALALIKAIEERNSTIS